MPFVGTIILGSKKQKLQTKRGATSAATPLLNLISKYLLPKNPINQAKRRNHGNSTVAE